MNTLIFLADFSRIFNNILIYALQDSARVTLIMRFYFLFSKPFARNSAWMEDVVLDQTSVHAPTDLPVTAASKVKADRIFVKYSHIDTKPNPASLADVSLLM